jgi:guanine deaminase
MQLCVARGTGIACCPLSNFFFSGGAFPLRSAQAAGARVGLGTDVAGNPISNPTLNLPYS